MLPGGRPAEAEEEQDCRWRRVRPRWDGPGLL